VEGIFWAAFEFCDKRQWMKEGESRAAGNFLRCLLVIKYFFNSRLMIGLAFGHFLERLLSFAIKDYEWKKVRVAQRKIFRDIYLLLIGNDISYQISSTIQDDWGHFLERLLSFAIKDNAFISRWEPRSEKIFRDI
jgi:hypothetical protein